MWGSLEEPPGTMEADPPESVVNLKDTCEQSKTQLESVKDIMLRNKQTLKKKEEELQKYAKKLSKFKTRAKKSRSNKSDEMSSTESTPTSIPDTSTVEPADDVDDISQAKTPKAKSSLLQKKLAEDRKIFQQRSKELTESKRAVEEKVEALRQQFEEKYVTPVSVVSPIPVTSQTHSMIELSHVQDKDNKIAELSNKIFEMEAVIIDLQDNLKEKDSVIDSKTKAVTLMSADLSKKGKTTLDSLEDTKDEMRLMQENFLLVETSLRSKNDNLLKQLQEKTQQISTLEENVQSLTDKLEVQKQTETINADFSRSTMDTLVDTKDAMKSMQENFVLIESSLKSKNEHLLKQLEEREIKLAEAEAKILNLETGIGIEKQPNIEELSYKVEKLEKTNRNLEDEKYELQKLIAGLQDKIISNELSIDNNLLIKKDNQIVELEGLIKELKTSNQLMEENKIDLEKKIDDLNKKNEELSVKDIETEVPDLENENEKFMKLIVSETEGSNEDEKVQKLIKELEELNKSMIKMKAAYEKKLKNMRRQLKNFKKVSDTNAELVKLGNQVTLLEEEKASSSDWQERISDLEGKVSTQAKEIQTHIEAIAILENQKLDLIQELHVAKQEVSSLEAENAESENLRVTAEMKVVDLEEELESSQRQSSRESLGDTERVELQHQIEALVHDNERLTQKISKLEELKSSSEIGSTDSFVKTGSNVDSTESFEALAADADKPELLKRIDGLMRENSALTEKLTRYEEKGSSDTGSTESFERIPEAGEEASKLESLARENYELAAKVTRLEEKLAIAITGQQSESISETESQRPKSTLEESPDEVEKPEKSSDLASSAIVFSAGLAGDWESDELPKPIDEGIPSVEEKTCANEASAIVEEQRSALVALERKCESYEALVTEQKTIIEELTTRLEEKEVKLAAELRSELESKDEELRAALVVRDKLRNELEVLSNHERAAEENLVTTRQNLEDLGNKLDAYSEEQRQLVNRLAERQALVEQLETKLELEGKLLREQLEEEERKVADLLEDKRGQEEAHGSTEKQLLELELRHEESLQHAANVSAELQQAYKSLELLKLKHTEDIDMLNQRLEDVIEELQLRTQDIASLESELVEKTSALEKSVSEEVKAGLEMQLAEMEEKAQVQLDKLKKYAAVAKKKTAQYEELEAKLSELEEKWTLEKSEKETRNIELRESLLSIQLKDNRIVHLEEELQRLETTRDEALREVDTVKLQLIGAVDKDNKIASMEEEMQRLQTSRNDALREIEIAMEKVNESQQKDNKIADLEDRLQNSEVIRDQLLQELKLVTIELIDASDKDKKIAQMTEELQRLQTIKDEALLEVNTIKIKLNEMGQKDNRITELEEELQRLKIDRDQTLQEIEIVKTELIEARENISRIADMQDELQRFEAERDTALHKVEVNLDELGRKEKQIADLENILHRYQTGEESCDEINKLKEELKEAKEKDKIISDTNEELKRLELANEEALHEVEVSKAQLNEFKEKDNIIAELKQELKRLQNTRDETLHEVEVVKAELSEAKDMLNFLSEAKDKARELGVRMEVMEAEYVEQLGQINSLRAENGLLLSKQAQVNERLENVEKESEERRVHLEKLEKEQLIAETRRSEMVEGTCGNCATRLQALEAMLQERDAEIENLDNELHNSIGNLMQMQDHLRMSTVQSAAAHDASAQESYDELARRYNILMSQSEETRVKYEATLRHNEDLRTRVVQLQDLNASMQVRLDTGERDITEQPKEQDQESFILSQSLEQSRSSGEDSTLADGWGLEMSTSVIETDLGQQELTNETVERQKREAPLPLFDASVFGASLSQVDSRDDLDLQVDKLKKEVTLLNEQLANERTSATFLKEELLKLQTSRNELEVAMASSNVAQIEQTKQLSHVQELENDNEALKVKINHLLTELEYMRSKLNDTRDVYKSQLIEAEFDNDQRLTELEDRITQITSERDLLQLQLNDLTREYDEHQKSSEADNKSLRNQLENSSQEKMQLVKELENLHRSDETASASINQEIPPESMWEDDEDPWGFNDKTIPHSSEEHMDIPVIPTATIQLQIRIDELEEKLKDLSDEKAKVVEENKNVQLKNAKCVKKLKEYKLQLDSLQQQLQLQKSMGSFGANLDSTIEEELKAQIQDLGTALAAAREDIRKMLLEKENLLKKIDVLMIASERFTDAKEKQDTELHIWQMRYKELEAKLQQMDSVSESKEMSSSSIQDNTVPVSKYKEEIKELKENVDALAAENEELQQLLEEHRMKREININELQAKSAELIASNEQLTNDYSNLKKQYQQSQIDANDQVESMRQNYSLLEKKLETAVNDNEQLTQEVYSGKKQIDWLMLEIDRYSQLQDHLQMREKEMDRLNEELRNRPEIDNILAELQSVREDLKKRESSIEDYVTKVHEQTEKIHALQETLNNHKTALDEKDQYLTALHSQSDAQSQELHEAKLQISNQNSDIQVLQKHLHDRESTITMLEQQSNDMVTVQQYNRLKEEIVEKDTLLKQMQETNDKLEAKVLEHSSRFEEKAAVSHGAEMSMLTFPYSNDENELQRLKAELAVKNSEVNRLQDWIENNSTTLIVQQMQDNINELYNEKSALEDRLTAKNQEIEAFKTQAEEEQRLRKRSLDEEDRLMKLQGELQSRDQELLELRQAMNDKESQLKAALERGTSDADGLETELREKQLQLESLKFTVAELQSEVANLRALEGLVAEDRAAIDRLSSEKEQVRRDAQETIERILKEKENEINAVKRRLTDEKENLTEALGLRGRDVENLKLQIKQTILDRDAILEQKTEQVARLETELSERDRRLAELSITKDTEIHNMRVQLSEKNARLEELIALSEEEEKQLAEMRNILESKELQINGLKEQLAEKSKEFELMQHALQRHAINTEQPSQVLKKQQLQHSLSGEVPVESTTSSSTTDELDLALYMLHQRDMRCEELTRELMQLLEERDTLQLRLSNAIRVNEELRKYKTSSVASSPKRSPSTEETVENPEPLVQDPSPSHSEGPIEIAREAINSSIGEDKKALAQKLLQLKTVDQGRDVRLRDERELRHAQQMSLLAHGDVLSTLPPEAAARLVNANYTLSRDVQSQSSVLMNWLWGKSTPKIVHM